MEIPNELIIGLCVLFVTVLIGVLAYIVKKIHTIEIKFERHEAKIENFEKEINNLVIKLAKNDIRKKFGGENQ